MELDLDALIDVTDALMILDAAPVDPRTETVDLADAAGRVLAVDVVADRDYPAFDKALMDGYAVRAVDTAAPLACVGEVAAGNRAAGPLAAGQCVAIMTGAPLPPGADSVVPIEKTCRVGNVVTIDRPVKAGASVSPRAADAPAGRVLLTAGTRLSPAAIGVCALVGVTTPRVFARPRVGILSTGDEIVPYHATPGDTQLRNSNSPMLAAVVRRYGCDAVDLGHADDDPAAIAAKLATPGLNAILVTGGMSMGVYDYTPRVLQDLGYDLAITKLKIKPGKPFVFAKRGTGAWGVGLGEEKNARLHQAPSPKPESPPFVFGLPGNPVSAFVCTVRLASRVLLRLAGASPDAEWVAANLQEPLPANGPREFYLPALEDDGVVRLPAWGGSADLFTLARVNALLCRPAGQAPLPKGSRVALIRLP